MLLAFNPLAAGQLQYHYLVQRRDGFEIEAIKAFDGRELCRLDPALPQTAFRVDQFQLRQSGQIAHMVHTFGGTNTYLLVMLRLPPASS